MVRAIVITRASKGIGRAAAHALLGDRWSVIGVARSCCPGVFIETDLADREKTQALADDARGNILGIVNNVGLARHEAMGAVDPDRSAALMDLNVAPALQLAQALLPGLRAAKFGRIINVTSLVTRGLAFLASHVAAFITGQTLFADGGASLRIL